MAAAGEAQEEQQRECASLLPTDIIKERTEGEIKNFDDLGRIGLQAPERFAGGSCALHTAVAEWPNFYSETLPTMLESVVRVAKSIEDKGGLELLLKGSQQTLTLTRLEVFGLVSAGFLGLVPKQASHRDLPNFDFALILERGRREERP